MKKRVSKITTVLFLLFLLFLVIGCKGRVPAGEKPTDTATALRQVQTGTQGVVVRLLPNYPPPVLYSDNELVAILELNNKGNHNLDQSSCFVQITGFDPNIIQGGFGAVHRCAENTETLEGKNVYNLEGGMNQLEFRSSSLNLPPKVYEYNPRLNIVTCYDYQTTASPLVCVDPLLYQVTSEQKSCQPLDVSMGGGQGGPVGVGYVGVDMVGSKAIFEINIRASGTGRVLSPGADISRCAGTALDYTDVDKVEYSVSLSNAGPLNCKPQDGIVRLSNGQGKIVCTSQIPGGSAYETPLLITLKYGYIDSLQKQIKIIQTPGGIS